MKRFGNPDQKKANGKPFDGIHMRGVIGGRHYTNSMSRIFASQFPSLLVGQSDSQSQSANFHEICPQTNYRRRHGPKFRANYQGNYGHEQQTYSQNNGQGFSQQPGFNRARGFKRNNNNVQGNYYQHGDNEYTDGQYNVPVWNRFTKNF